MAINKKPKQRRRRSEGYLHKSPAVCVVVHDPSGRYMPDGQATEILSAVTDIALKHGYLINFTRT